MARRWKDGWVDVDGVQLHYVTQGSGPLMLMLHGFPDFWYSWRHQIPEFARDHSVVAVDMRGYNLSDKPPGRSAYSMRYLVADVGALIERLGEGRAVLVGHDWGGLVAWASAYEHPELLEALIILNTPHPALFMRGLLWPPQLLRSSYVFMFQLPWLPEWLLTGNDGAAMETILRGSAVDKTAFTDDDIAAYREAIQQPGAATAALNYYRNWFQPRVLRTFDVLEVPTLMIWGDRDVALGKELARGTERYVRRLTLHHVPDSGHWVQQEQPGLVNRYIRDFLAELRGGSSGQSGRRGSERRAGRSP
jgi:pimeloyl-ACP methyl ester carboxylesterase